MDFSFVIETKDLRSYYLVASSEEEMMEWISIIQKYILTLGETQVVRRRDSIWNFFSGSLKF